MVFPQEKSQRKSRESAISLLCRLDMWTNQDRSAWEKPMSPNIFFKMFECIIQQQKALSNYLRSLLNITLNRKKLRKASRRRQEVSRHRSQRKKKSPYTSTIEKGHMQQTTTHQMLQEALTYHLKPMSRDVHCALKMAASTTIQPSTVPF